MKAVIPWLLIGAVLAGVAVVLAYERGKQVGRGDGCEKGIRMENQRVHDDWCRLVMQHGAARLLGANCDRLWEGILPVDSVRACVSE